MRFLFFFCCTPYIARQYVVFLWLILITWLVTLEQSCSFDWKDVCKRAVLFGAFANRRFQALFCVQISSCDAFAIGMVCRFGLSHYCDDYLMAYQWPNQYEFNLRNLEKSRDIYMFRAYAKVRSRIFEIVARLFLNHFHVRWKILLEYMS